MREAWTLRITDRHLLLCHSLSGRTSLPALSLAPRPLCGGRLVQPHGAAAGPQLRWTAQARRPPQAAQGRGLLTREGRPMAGTSRETHQGRPSGEVHGERLSLAPEAREAHPRPVGACLAQIPLNAPFVPNSSCHRQDASPAPSTPPPYRLHAPRGHHPAGTRQSALPDRAPRPLLYAADAACRAPCRRGPRLDRL
jgi:hypothetical protein